MVHNITSRIDRIIYQQILSFLLLTGTVIIAKIGTSQPITINILKLIDLKYFHL